ncbi:MAG: MarR family winged helix-turn-helix transcriptional regulator [Pseudomonadota bacterium]|nr:MarR family winged helix-turn-helix transcriptional regulator [Pseudomonadota bacterium]MEE3100427.1 MarR family winged helix-turn-helix transcriptional regulator [Pseudomonadota bacterium]
MNRPSSVMPSSAAGEGEAPAYVAPTSDDATVNVRSLGFLVQDTARLLRVEFGRRVAQAGLELTTGEARALVHAVSAAGARQTEIAERMGVEPMTLCGYVDRLEKRGMVTRQPHPDDKRAKRIMPTPEAETAIATIMPMARRSINEAMEGLPEADVLAFRRVLEHLHDQLADARRDG